MKTAKEKLRQILVAGLFKDSILIEVISKFARLKAIAITFHLIV